MGFIDLVFGDRTEKKRALLERARVCLREGRVEKALLAAEKARRLDPDSSDARETLGEIQMKLGQLAWADGDLEAAIECYTQASRLLSDPVVLFYRGLAHREAHQLLKAIEDFSRVMRSEEIHALPYASYATFCRGLCYREMGELKHAKKDFTTCIEADPDSPLRHRYLAHRAMARAAMGERAQALEDLRAAEALAPDATEVSLARATLSALTLPETRGLPAPRAMPEQDELVLASEPAFSAGDAGTTRAPDPEPTLFEVDQLDWSGAVPEEPLGTGDPPPAAEPSWIAAATAAVAARAPAPTAGARRCAEKIVHLADRFDAEPALFDDLDFCVDYLLVVARLRELGREDKRAVAAELGESGIARLERTEGRARDRLLALPSAAAARALAEEAMSLLDRAPPPPRLPGTLQEPAIRALVGRFELLSRPEKYLFLEACGPRRFARFTEYLLALEGHEAHP